MSVLLFRIRPFILAASGGVLGFLGYVGFDQFYLEWIFLAFILWAIRRLSPRRAFFVAWAGGTVGHAGGFYWIIPTLTVFGNFATPLAVVCMILLAVVNALSFALWGWAVRRTRVATGWGVWWLAPLYWVAIEHFYPFLFPNYIGASQYMLPRMTQLADLTGILGVSFVVVLINGIVFEIIERRVEKQPFPLRPAAISALLIALVLGYGHWRLSVLDQAIQAAPKIKAALIQTNLGAKQKHLDRQGFLDLHHRLSIEAERQKPDLIVWPEGAYNYYLPHEIKQLDRRVLGGIQTATLFGALRVKREEGVPKRYNSALLADSRHQVLGGYDKMVLVPFGEYIPLGDTFPIIYKWSPYSGRYYSGANFDPLPWGDYLLSVNICYEDLFPGLVRKLVVGPDGNREVLPHALVNVTNDSWYGDTTEPLQHLVLASFRAIEHHRPLIRSTNTGISALVDPAGRITQRTGQHVQAILVGDVPMMSGETLFGELGNWFGWTLFLVAVGCLGWSMRRRPGRPGPGVRPA